MALRAVRVVAGSWGGIKACVSGSKMVPGVTRGSLN